uniref:Secreted protein n=1 Tax=Thraustotheca clavata TaxID=74557 RepID=A0A0A7CMH6_9STRA|nr:secreted protein [Thraustotheca clavata]
MWTALAVTWTLFGLAASSSSSSCAYSDLPATANAIWTTEALCDGTSPCVVDRSCKKSTDKPNAYGDLTNLTTNTSLTLGDVPTLDVSHAVLPPTVQTLTFEDVGQFTGLNKMTIPTSLEDVYFVNSSNGAFPKGLTWPASLQSINVYNTENVDVQYLTMPGKANLLDFWNVSHVANLDKLVLPKSLEVIYFSNCTIQVIPPGLEWPSSMLNLYTCMIANFLKTLIDNQLQDIPHNLPESLNFLYVQSIHQNYIYDLGTDLPNNISVLYKYLSNLFL